MSQHRDRTTSPARRTKAEWTDLDGLLGWETLPVLDAPSRRQAVRGGVIAAVLASLFVCALSSPLVGAAAVSVRQGARYWASLPAHLPVQALPTKSVMLAADGTRIAQFYSENRIPVTIDQIPRVMRDAIVDIEDSRFFEHGGVDPRGTVRALAHNLLSGSTQGGSTLTQQYVKNVLASAAEDDAARAAVTSRTSYMRKLREAKLAVELEKRMTKEEILVGYLNISYFGDGAYGVGAAARHYFDKPLPEIAPAQAALLAGLVKNPNGLDPTNNKAAARKRRDVVLTRMHDLGDLSDAEYRQALATPIRLHVTQTPNGCTSSRFPFFCQWVKQTLENDPVFGATKAQRQARLYTGGMVIKTSLDPKAQSIAQRTVDQALGRDNPVASAAVVVQPGTGDVVAMATNRTFGTPTRQEAREGRFDKTEVILPIEHAMQPGSNFKPFTLAAALERGFDPTTRFNAPSVYAPAGMNYPNHGFTNDGSADAGDFDARTAIARSSNTWFVKLEEQVGVLNVADMAERLGITSLPRTGKGAITARDASLTLGTYEVSPVEMAGAYATFAAHGIHCTPHPIVSITGPREDGKIEQIEVPDPDCHQAIQPAVADTVADIMTATIDGPDHARTGAKQTIGRPAAGKTGTTQNRAAVWFSGYTPQYATSVWVGDPRGGFAHPLKGFYAYGSYVAAAYGGSVAGPIWQRIMAGIHSGVPVERFTKPTQSVATGTVVPDVRGLPLEAAYRALEEAGFKVSVTNSTAKRDAVIPAGVVARTSPAAGSFLGLDADVQVTMTAGSDLSVGLPRR